MRIACCCTRARQGIVVFVSPGDESDPTRQPAFDDLTFEYLSSLGIPSLSVQAFVFFVPFVVSVVVAV
jgi:hypothetical protein